MPKKAITIREWWEKAEKSGKNAFGTLSNLAEITGLSEGKLQTLFQFSVSTLGEWWNVIGTVVHGRQEDFAQKLGIPRRTLTGYIHGGTPKYREYYEVLFAFTALPYFDLERQFPQESGRVVAVEVLSLALKDELGKLLEQNLSLEDQERFSEVLQELFGALEEAAEIAENETLARQMEEIFS